MRRRRMTEDNHLSFEHRSIPAKPGPYSMLSGGSASG